MDTLTFEQTREFKEHQAITHGGWKLAGGIIVHLWLILCAWALSRYAAAELERVMTAGWSYATGGGIFTIAFMLMNGVLFSRQRAWLARYWRKNVCGRVARFWRMDGVDDGGRAWSDLHSATRTRTEDAEERFQTHRLGDFQPAHPLAISLPLGGWFTSPMIITRDRDVQSHLAGWSVRLRAILDTGAVMVEVRHADRRWDVDERIVCDIGSALRHLEFVAMDTMHVLNGSWSCIIAHLDSALAYATREREELVRRLSPFFDPPGNIPTDRQSTAFVEEQVRQRVAERDAARETVERYKWEWLPAAIAGRDAALHARADACNFIEIVAMEIEGMSRFSSTIEGLEILERCMKWLHDAAEQGSMVQSQFRDRLAVVRTKLAEKRKADRRRHGRKADTTTP